MPRELDVEDILFPRQRRRLRRPPVNNNPPKTGKNFPRGLKIFCGVVLVLLSFLVIFSFSDIGGDLALDFAQKYLSEHYEIFLKADSMTGNPIRGYTLNNLEISHKDIPRKILSARFVSARANFLALLTGQVRLAEILAGGMEANVEQIISLVEKISDNDSNFMGRRQLNLPLLIAPAFAAEGELGIFSVPEVPIDKLLITDSKIFSDFGTLEIKELDANLAKFDIKLDATANGVTLNGTVDLDENSGLTSINRSEINLGSGKIIATGGLNGEAFDLHATAENLNLKELTALYPELLKPEEFEGIANLNAELSGTISDPVLSAEFNFKGEKIYSFPVERVSANISYSDYRLEVNNIQANALNIPVQGNIAVATRPGQVPSVMIKLDGSETNLGDLDKALKLEELKGLSGKVALFNANIHGPVNKLNGLVNFTAPRIAYNGYALSNIKAQMKLANSDSARVDGKFNFENANGYLQGSIASLLVNPKMNLTAKIAGLDIKRVEKFIPDSSEYKLAGNITASVALKGSVTDPVISGSLESPEFSGWQQKISKPVVNFNFSNKTLRLTKTTGTLNGMPINLNGTVGPLPSNNPSLNLNATIAMTPAALKNYVPDIDQYNLKGTVNAGVKIQGTVKKPSINLLASSQNLQALDILHARDIELTTAVGGDLTKIEKININASAKSITASGVTFSNIKSSINKNGDSIALQNFTASSGAGSITGSGTASASGKSPLNFNFNFSKLALASLASSAGVDLKGELTGTLKIKGNNTNPEIIFNAGVPVLNAAGFALNNLKADLSGNAENIKFNKVTAEVEGAEVVALGNLQLTPSLKLSMALNGANINLERLLKDFEGLKGNLTGTAGFNFNLTATDKNISGNGALNSKAIKAFGLSLSNINLPLAYSGNNFTSNGGKANLYGGEAKNNFNFDIKNMKFSDNLEASGVDVNALIQDVAGKLEGKISGTGKLTFKLNGNVKDSGASYSGSGNFSMGEGAITGFKWLDLVTKLHKTNGIRYASVNAPLTLQTGKLLINTGAIANAVKNDPLYKYAKLTRNGVVNFTGPNVTIDFMTESSINYQLINALQGGSVGGLQALFNGGTSSLEDGMKAFLTGGLQGAKQSGSTGDYRVVTLRISGKADSPSFSAFKVGESTLKTAAAASASSTQSADKNISEKIINKAVESVLPKGNNDNAVKNKAREVLTEQLQRVIPSGQQNNNNSNNQNNNATQQARPSTTDIKQGIKDALQNKENQEKIKEGIIKGLGGLFK